MFKERYERGASVGRTEWGVGRGEREDKEKRKHSGDREQRHALKELRAGQVAGGQTRGSAG